MPPAPPALETYTGEYASAKTQVELYISRRLFNFPTEAALCMTNFTTHKPKMDKSNFGEVEHVFPFSHSDKSKPSKTISLSNASIFLT